jgi:hypothetical protein
MSATVTWMDADYVSIAWAPAGTTIGEDRVSDGNTALIISTVSDTLVLEGTQSQLLEVANAIGDAAAESKTQLQYLWNPGC